MSNVFEGAAQTSQKRSRLGSFAMILAVFSLVFTSLMPMASQPAAAQSSNWAPPATVYIPETGHTLDRLFLDMWRNAGGASAFGYPITPEITLENGHIIQYLQYARFEYWPEGDANGNTVLLGKIGEELRPITLQRSMIASSKPAQSSDLAESAALMKAWLPVEEEDAKIAEGENALYVEATGHVIRTGFLDFWYNTGAENYLGNPLTEEYTLDGVIYQVFERGQLQYSPETGVMMVPVGQVLAEKYNLDTEPIAQGNVPTYDEALFVPPPEPTPAPVEVANVPTGEVWIDINLSYEYMTVYQGNTVVMETYISSGKPGFETPPGTYYVNTKLESQTMEGVLGGEYYHVPDVPWVMYFTNVGHAIHGTYWHNNFGTPMSHGCINVPVDLAEYLYNISPIGTRVEIHW